MGQSNSSNSVFEIIYSVSCNKNLLTVKELTVRGSNVRGKERENESQNEKQTELE